MRYRMRTGFRLAPSLISFTFFSVISHHFPSSSHQESRKFIQTFHNFGCVSLSLHPTYPEDAGTYTCVLFNAHGQVDTNLVKKIVIPYAHIQKTLFSRLNALRNLPLSKCQRFKPTPNIRIVCRSSDIWTATRYVWCCSAFLLLLLNDCGLFDVRLRFLIRFYSFLIIF